MPKTNTQEVVSNFTTLRHSGRTPLLAEGSGEAFPVKIADEASFIIRPLCALYYTAPGGYLALR